MELRVKSCPHCGGAAEFVFRVPVYGFHGTEVKCTMCGATLRDTNCAEHYIKDGTYHTPITTESMVKCVERCIEAWNRRVSDAEV